MSNSSIVPEINLHDDVEKILGRSPELIIDIGAQRGDTTIGYLQRFPTCRVCAFEPELENYTHAKTRLAAFAARAQLFMDAIGDVSAPVQLNVNSHSGTHSLLESGDQRYWDGSVATLNQTSVRCRRLDDFFDEFKIEKADLLAMDIQGAELRALKGAERLLTDHRVALVYCEVEFYELYKRQPLFWDVGSYLHRKGYHLYALYDPHYHKDNPRVLSWADALFVSRLLLSIPERTEQDGTAFNR
jgi:FkbM family methyltransferase